MGIHKNYAEMENNNKEMQEHVDKMFDLVVKYARKNGLKVAPDDRAEILVEAIATYIVDSAE